MRAFKTVLYLLALVPLLTGPLDLTLGLQAPHMIGAVLTPEDLRDPLLNSQISYFGAIWLGFGVFLWIFISDIAKYSSLLRGALGIVFLGGVGRLISLAQYGLPTTPVGKVFVITVTVIEIFGMPLLLWWHSRIVGKR